MSHSRTKSVAIAARYAAAMFELALQAGKQAMLAAQIRTLADAVKASVELAKALKNPLIARSKKRDVLLALLPKADALTRQSIAVLAEQGRAETLPYVADALEAMLARHEGTLNADVVSARPLPESVQMQLREALTKATGKNVSLRLREDASVLGGVAVRIGSHLLDATLAGALNTLKYKLIQGSSEQSVARSSSH